MGRVQNIYIYINMTSQIKEFMCCRDFKVNLFDRYLNAKVGHHASILRDQAGCRVSFVF